jgi:hypothetical protein
MRKGKRLTQSGANALVLLIHATVISHIVRGILFLDVSGWEVEIPEITVFPRDIVAGYWLTVAVLTLYSAFSRSHFLWRLSFVFTSIGYFIWLQILIEETGQESLNDVITYMFLSVIYFAVAIRADDPRPLQMLKRQMDDSSDLFSTD